MRVIRMSRQAISVTQFLPGPARHDAVFFPLVHMENNFFFQKPAERLPENAMLLTIRYYFHF